MGVASELAGALAVAVILLSAPLLLFGALLLASGLEAHDAGEFVAGWLTVSLAASLVGTAAAVAAPGAEWVDDREA